MNEQSMYLVWCPQGNSPTKRHPDVDSARAEARRLCQLDENIGKTFFVLRAVESVQYRTDPFVCKSYARR